jgi:hypothetical protein
MEIYSYARGIEGGVREHWQNNICRMRSAGKPLGKPETNNKSVNTGVLGFDPTRRLKNHTTRREYENAKEKERGDRA